MHKVKKKDTNACIFFCVFLFNKKERDPILIGDVCVPKNEAWIACYNDDKEIHENYHRQSHPVSHYLIS